MVSTAQPVLKRLVSIPADYINIRETPNGKIIGKFYLGEVAWVHGDRVSGDWVYIDGPALGWISMQGGKVVLQPVEDPESEVLLNVPYFSQWDSSAMKSVGDCGIACVAMVGAFYGRPMAIDTLLAKAGLPGGRLSYHFNELMKASRVLNITLRYTYPASLPVIQAELAEGRPVITLLRYGEISGNQDRFQGAHFVVVTGYNNKFIRINDPDFKGDRIAEGHHRSVPISEFVRAIGPALNRTGNTAYQSLFVEKVS